MKHHHRWKRWHKRTQRCVRTGCRVLRGKIGTRYVYRWLKGRIWTVICLPCRGERAQP